MVGVVGGVVVGVGPLAGVLQRMEGAGDGVVFALPVGGVARLLRWWGGEELGGVGGWS